MICKKCDVEKDLNSFSKEGKYYRTTCKECRKLERLVLNRTVSGVIRVIYRSQHGSSKKRGHSAPDFSLEELREFLMKQPKFKDLYDNWVVSGFNTWLKPSCDRQINSKPYTLNNIELMTWKENNDNWAKAVIAGDVKFLSKEVQQFTMDNVFIATFNSTQSAARSLNKACGSKIAAVARGSVNRISAYGFKWKYTQEGVLDEME